jgi:hypothetical protein
MKIRSLLTLIALATSFAVPVLAQEKDSVDSKTVEQLSALLSKKTDEAFNDGDAAALAALFTEDGVLVAPDRMFNGRQDIEKGYADTFQLSPVTDFNSRRAVT